MKLRIFVNPSRLRRWHLLLGHRLAAKGHEISFAFAEGGPTLSSMLEALLRLERVFYRLRGQRPSQRVRFEEASRFLDNMEKPDLVIDLTLIGAGRGQAESAQVPLFHILFDGELSEAAAVGAILSGENPLVTVADGTGQTLAIGRPAIEKPYVLGQALDDVFTRAITLLIKAIDKHDVVQPASMPVGRRIRASAWALARFGFSSFLTRLAVNAKLMARERSHWRTGWRWLDDVFRPINETGAWADTEHHWLADDGQRYFADPFAIAHEGRTMVFCEEVPSSTHRGVISVFAIDADGQATRPIVVLERPYHLSYPFVFEQEGHFFMIPETLANGTVELYRAERFPDRWSLDTVLLSGVEASDSTLIEHEGRFWLFATERDGGSTWDCLSIWYADSLRGPWLPHRMNPVLIDAAGARPAGPIIRRGGKLQRPAQDCTGFYGKGLSMKDISRLDLAGFDERDHLVADKPCRIRGIHTLSQSDGWQLIDTLDAPAKTRTR